MMEKNQMLDQLYNTLKQLKQQFEASRQVQAPAATRTCALQCRISVLLKFLAPGCCDEQEVSAPSKP